MSPIANEQCRLCLQYVTKLRRSHFLPAGIYKILRDDREKNPNPWSITAKAAFQSSCQMTAPLLCDSCEQRFSKCGEAWVLRHCLQKDRTFPLMAILVSRTPDVSSNGTSTRIYYAAKIPEIDISALAYFAVSIFWRGSIHPWNDDGSIPVNFGPFHEQFRKYLLGMSGFPEDCSLWVTIREGKEIDRLTYAPVGQRIAKLHAYRFPMPGLAFLLTVSKNIPATYRDLCVIHGQGNPIVVTTLIDAWIMENTAKMYQQSKRKRATA